MEIAAADAARFYEFAIVGLATLEGICFGVLGLLFNIYHQYMVGLDPDTNPHPPAVARQITLICRGLAVLIASSALVSLLAFTKLAAPSGDLVANVILFVFVGFSLGLAGTATWMVTKMKVK
jgi:hypothetical protein